MLTKARAFALHAHGDQTYGSRPYAYHLDMVADSLVPYGEQAQVIGYLHDVIEDTRVTREEIEREFGPLVAECVALVSDGPGGSGAEKKARTYARLAKVTGPAQLALVVKAADRLSNVRACVADGNATKLAGYVNAHPAFRNAAYRAGLCDPLWAELDRLVADHARGDHA